MSKVIRCPLCKVKLFKISTEGHKEKVELRCLHCKRSITIPVQSEEKSSKIKE